MKRYGMSIGVAAGLGLAALAGFAAAQDDMEGPDGTARPRRPPLKEMDTNGDGLVSLAEFKAYHNAKLEALFKKMDRNGDGMLSPADRPTGGAGDAEDKGPAANTGRKRTGDSDGPRARGGPATER